MKDIIQGKSRQEIRAKVKQLDLERLEKEALDFIDHLKQTSPYHVDPNDKAKLNRLCYIEDWENKEIIEALSELQHASLPGFIHRKPWEWALGIVAMSRFGKLNKDCTAIGVGSGTEAIIFYLTNKLKHVYATDLYEGKEWKQAPTDFPANPKKYAPFPYNEKALTVLRMDATKLEFLSDSFDIAFSFSSIEHFGGMNHSGALQSLKEIQRVLKPKGIAIVATEYIINNKEHPEFFNRKTIYSDLLDKLEMQLVEPLDLRITNKTLDTVMDFFISENWLNLDEDYRRTHPVILLRLYNILYTSVMLVFQKK